MTEPTIATVIPSYRRPQDLQRCLRALRRQTRPPDQTIVAARSGDGPTFAALRAEVTPVTVATVHAPGQIAALNGGMELVKTDIVAFTDDDAAPREDWLERIAKHFREDPRLGGLGGRDWIHHGNRVWSEERAVVGMLSWWGRCVGNHHLGVGPPRQVDVLKGANMSFRRLALDGVRFDTRLLGSGAQVFNELGVCLAVKRRGWKLVYDPLVAVDHYPSIRYDEDQRESFSWQAVRNGAFNEALQLAEHFGPTRATIFLIWALALGHRASPGILQWLRLLLAEPKTATARFTAAWSGRIAGWRAAH